MTDIIGNPGGCSWYRTSVEAFCARRTAWWRPANLPMAKGEWFCKQHAKRIAREEGMFGVYYRGNPGLVEELPSP